MLFRPRLPVPAGLPRNWSDAQLSCSIHQPFRLDELRGIVRFPRHVDAIGDVQVPMCFCRNDPAFAMQTISQAIACAVSQPLYLSVSNELWSQQLERQEASVQ
jgi:hypothetical protein